MFILPIDINKHFIFQPVGNFVSVEFYNVFFLINM